MTAAGRRAAGTAQAWRRRQAAGARVRGRARGAEGWHRTASKVTSPSTCLKPRRASSGASASSGARSSRFAITETSVHGARPARHSRLSAATTCAAPPHSRGQRARRAGGTGGARGGGGVHTKVLRVSRGLLVAKRNSAGSPAASPPAGPPVPAQLHQRHLPDGVQREDVSAVRLHQLRRGALSGTSTSQARSGARCWRAQLGPHGVGWGLLCL